MKYLLSFLIGVVISVSFVLIFFTVSHERPGIEVLVENDTSIKVDRVFLSVSNGQEFSCTLRFNRCNMSLLEIGDSSIKVVVVTGAGEKLFGSIGYAEPGSKYSVKISDLSKENT